MTDVQDLNLLSLETGDVLLFSGRGPVSAVIRVFTRSPWSHIGLVVRLPGYPEPLVLEALRLNGEDYVIGLDGRASISDRMLTLAGVFTTRFEDLSRFSDLAGRPLSGSLEGTLSGGGDPLGGLFSAELDLQGTGLSTGIAQIDPLIASGVRIKGGAARGPEGTTLNGLRIEADGLDVTLDGKLSTQASEVALDVALDEVERLVPALPGQATVTGRASRDGAEAPWSLDLRVTAPRDITASVIGTTAGAIFICASSSELCCVKKVSTILSRVAAG